MIIKDNETGRVTVEFGHGSIGICAIDDTLLIKNLGKPGELNQGVRHLANESDIFFTFTKTESINYLIEHLVEIKQYLERLEKFNQKENV